MYSTAKKMATAGAIICVLNIIGGILLIMVAVYLEVSFTIRFALIMYVITMTISPLLLTLGLRSLCQDLDYEYESNAKKLKEITTDIANLQNKTY